MSPTSWPATHGKAGACNPAHHLLFRFPRGAHDGGLHMALLNYGRGRGGGGGGFNMRWIIALVIAGIGVIGYFMKTQVNPVTGEKQRVALTVDQEKALGL